MTYSAQIKKEKKNSNSIYIDKVIGKVVFSNMC